MYSGLTRAALFSAVTGAAALAACGGPGKKAGVCVIDASADSGRQVPLCFSVESSFDCSGTFMAGGSCKEQGYDVPCNESDAGVMTSGDDCYVPPACPPGDAGTEGPCRPTDLIASTTELCIEPAIARVAQPSGTSNEAAGVQLKFRVSHCRGDGLDGLNASNVDVINNETATSISKNPLEGGVEAIPDAGAGDASATDAGTADAGTADAGAADAGSPSMDASSDGVTTENDGERLVVQRTAHLSGLEIYTLLAIDVSNSVVGQSAAYDRMLSDSKDFALTLAEEYGHSVGVYVIGAPTRSELLLEFTSNADEIRGAFETLEVDTGRGGADLYGGYAAAMAELARPAVSSTVLERFMVWIAASPHAAGDIEGTLAAASKAHDKSLGRVFSVALGPDVDTCRMRALSGPGAASPKPATPVDCGSLDDCGSEITALGSCDDASSSDRFSGGNGALKNALLATRQAMLKATGETYSVGICTALSLGEPELTLRVSTSTSEGERAVVFSTEGLAGTPRRCDPALIASLDCDAADAECRAPFVVEMKKEK